MDEFTIGLCLICTCIGFGIGYPIATLIGWKQGEKRVLDALDEEHIIMIKAELDSPSANDLVRFTKMRLRGTPKKDAHEFWSKRAGRINESKMDEAIG